MRGLKRSVCIVHCHNINTCEHMCCSFVSTADTQTARRLEVEIMRRIKYLNDVRNMSEMECDKECICTHARLTAFVWVCERAKK